MKTEKEDDEPIQPEETLRNSWLYTTDNFGRLEKDLVYDAKTYPTYLKEPEKNPFKIISGKKKNAPKKK